MDTAEKAKEACATRPPTLHHRAPRFEARTTKGPRQLDDYYGKWLLLFSHPADFTAVCTSEFVAFAHAHDQFAEMECELLALSVDSLYAHLAWERSIEDRFGVTIPFPIIEDPTMSIAQAYGMLDSKATTSATVRASFVIDPAGVIRAITWYPMNIGRSVDEHLRLLAALQASDRHGALAPEGWRRGEPLVMASPLTASEAAERAAMPGATDWYYCRQSTVDA